MELSAKKVIANLFYYTFALLVLLFCVLFMVRMAFQSLAVYQLVVYYIWAGLAVIVLLADVICTMLHRYKLIVGLAIYGLMIIFLIIGFIVFAGMSVGGLIPAATMGAFNTLIIFSLVITVGLIIVYSLGLKVMRLDHEEEPLM